MKRIFSKKSGFTLVEIVVAFAIFSIMAAMLVQVLNLTVNRQAENQKYEAWIMDQGKKLATTDKDLEYKPDEKNSDGNANDGNITLNFVDDAGNPLFTDEDGNPVWKLPYQTVSADGTLHDPSGLNYFVGDITYAEGGETTEKDKADDEDGKDEADMGGSSQMSRFDTRITGTKGVSSVKVRYESLGGNATDGYEYKFYVTVSDSGVDPKIKNHSQVTLVFGEGESGGELAKIKSVNNGEKSTEKLKYVKKCGENGVNVHCPDDNQGFNGRETSFTVKFKAPINNLGFGDNGVGSLTSGGCSFSMYNGYTNIFGAYEKASS